MTGSNINTPAAPTTCAESFDLDPAAPEALPEKRTYTVQELQLILNVSRPTVYNLINQKVFQAFQINRGKWRISKKSFDAWLDAK